MQGTRAGFLSLFHFQAFIFQHRGKKNPCQYIYETYETCGPQGQDGHAAPR